MDIMCLHAQSLSHVQSFSTPLTVDPLSWNPPGKNTGVGSHPFSRDLPDPGIELWSPALQADSLLLSHQGSIMEHALYYTIILKWKQWQTLFSWAPKLLKKVAVAMKLKNTHTHTHTLARWEESYDKTSLCIKKQRYHFACKGSHAQSYGFSSSQLSQ